MADYRSMYYKLFNKVTDVINDLQEVQRLCEQIFVDSEETAVEMRLAERPKEKDENI